MVVWWCGGVEAWRCGSVVVWWCGGVDVAIGHWVHLVPVVAIISTAAGRSLACLARISAHSFRLFTGVAGLTGFRGFPSVYGVPEPIDHPAPRHRQGVALLPHHLAMIHGLAPWGGTRSELVSAAEVVTPLTVMQGRLWKVVDQCSRGRETHYSDTGRVADQRVVGVVKLMTVTQGRLWTSEQ